MELPLGGPALRHYTQSRPRPHRQKLNYRPSRPQETIIESENEVLELMGRVDEGVEEFFTKRVLPADTLKQQDEESITVHEVAPASSVPCPPPTKTLRRKLGDFFTLKKRRGLKSETSHEGRPKKASIADLIRPLREVARSEKDKDKDRVKEHDKENEKEKAKEPPTAVSGEPAVRETPVSGAPPLRGEAVPPRRALREGKSQSLILLSGSAAAGSTNARNTAKKQFEGQNSFEQKLHLMLQRIGVSKPLPGETQDQEGEMKKAESEGTIIDNKPEPPPTFSKPRTMSASSDTRHQIRASVSAHEGAGKPALLPKPVIKPGPPPTTSGRNTPENELAQIQEAETNTPTKLSPLATPSPPATSAPTAPTISNSVPDSTDFKVSPSSPVTPSDADICTDSPAAAAAASTNATVCDGEAAVPETTTTPTEPPTTVSVTSTSSHSVTPSLAATSNTAATIAGPSITTSETVSAPSHESSVSTAPTNLSTKSTLPEPSGIFSVDAAPAAGGDAAISVITAASVLCTSISDVPPGLSTTTIGEVSHKPTLVASSSSSTLVTKTASPPSDSSDIITVTISHDPPFTASSTVVSTALTPTTSALSSTPTTITQTADDSINSVSSSTVIHPTTTSVPPTSSSETNPTDTTSTATSLNRADTTSTASSSTSGAISSPLTTGSDPPFSNNVSAKLTPTISILPATDNSSATSTAAPSDDSPGQDNVIKTTPEESSSIEPAEKGTADGEQKCKVPEMDEKKEVVDGWSQSEKPTLVQSDLTTKEVQQESVKVEADKTAEPGAGEEGESSTDEAVIVDQKQEETKPVSDK